MNYTLRKDILLLICFLFLLLPLNSFSQEKAFDTIAAKTTKIDKKLDTNGITKAYKVDIAKVNKVGLFGINYDDWFIILIIFIIVETFWLILITIKYRNKEKEKNNLHSGLTDFLRASLYKIPESFEPDNLPPLPENLDEINEKIELLNEKDYSVIELFVKLGNVEYAKGNISKAQYFYEKALGQSIKQNFKDIRGTCLNNIGQIYLQKGELDTALKYFDDALATHKKVGYKEDEASHLSNIGLVYLMKEKYDKSIKYFTKALELKPDSVRLYHNRGIAYHKINEKEKAQKDFDKEKELNNNKNIS